MGQSLCDLVLFHAVGRGADQHGDTGSFGGGQRDRPECGGDHAGFRNGHQDPTLGGMIAGESAC